MTPFATDRLIVRNFRAEDGCDLLSYLERPSARWFISLAVEDLAQATAVAIERSLADDYLDVALKNDGPVIGDVFAIADRDAGAGHPDTFAVGWNLNPRFGRLGYAFEAAYALFGHLFVTQGARRLYAYVDDGNAPSEHLCKRLGMRQEGIFLEYVTFGSDANGVLI